MTSIGPYNYEVDQNKREKALEQELVDEQIEEQNNGLGSLDEQKQKEHHRRGKRTLLAAEKGRLMELLYYLRLDRNLVNYTDSDGYTPLHRASYSGNKDCVNYLLKYGANIEAKTGEGWTPLHCAVRWNNVEVADYLIRKGANVNAASSGGNTPLHIVVSNGCYSITCDIIQLLLFHPDCNYELKNDSGDTAYSIAKRSGPFYKFWSGVMTLDPTD